MSPEALPEVEIQVWEQPWFFTSIKQAGASVIVLFLIFGVLRPAMKSVVGGAPAARKGAPRLAVAGPAPSIDVGDDTVAVSAPAQAQAQLEPPPPPPPSVYDQNLNRAQSLVSQEPQRAARMIQNWLTNE